MTKYEAKALFGGSYAALGRALGTSRQWAWQLPDVLTQAQEDRVRGAAMRLGAKHPPGAKPAKKGKGKALLSEPAKKRDDAKTSGNGLWITDLE